MDLYTYMDRAASTAIYPDHELATSIPGLMYLALGLGGESGEVLDHVKKIYGKSYTDPLDYPKLMLIKEELGDVAWFWILICRQLGFDPVEVLMENLEKLGVREAEGTLLVR